MSNFDRVFDLHGIGNKDSVSFAHAILRSKILDPPTSSTVNISFKNLKKNDFLRLEDLATLTLIVRMLAEAGHKVVVDWPVLIRGNLVDYKQFLST